MGFVSGHAFMRAVNATFSARLQALLCRKGVSLQAVMLNTNMLNANIDALPRGIRPR
jgi:hypothetical protein